MQRHLRNQVDMKRRSRPDLEVRLEKHGVLVDADPPFAVVHRIVWVGVNESSGGNQRGTLHIGKLIGGRRRRKYVWKNEKSNRDAESSAKHSAKYEDRDVAPKSVHGSVSGVHVRGSALSLQRLKLAHHGGKQLRHGRMDMHRPPEDGVGRLGVHEVEQRMDDLVRANSKQRCTEDKPRVLVDENFH